MTPSLAALQHTTDAISSPLVTHYRTAAVDGVDIFYREAGPADGPAIVLLHGFPTSSHMFRNLIPLLADRYHVIAPDYPGFGLSAAPDRAVFDYGFGRYAHLMDNLLEKLGVQRYAMYVMDYGAPVGYRLALKHPDRVTGIIVQNGNAYEEGLKAFWDPIKAYWADGSATQCRTETARRAASSPPEAAKARDGGPSYEGRIIRRGDQSPEAMREKARFVLGVMEQRMTALGFGWADVTATQVYTIFDIHPLLPNEIVRRGASPGGLTWHFARPPVQGLDFEVDVRAVAHELVI